ncbi:MAG: hypothetical protein ACPG74_00450 [Candidatus Puniceispirillaceae bacterium]
MAKMPKNDNLVMESIEDLFQQADIVSENPSSAPSQLSREKPGKIPIIGARAVTLEKELPPGSDILVLAGQKCPLSEQSEPFFSAPSKKEGVADPRPSEAAAIQPESEDPFLAIRQAVISASDPDSPQTINSSEQKKDSAPAGITDNDTNPLGDQKFADQIARLIDREIELRLKAQLSILTLANHPAKAATQAEKTEKKSREKTARKPAPKKAQTKKSATKRAGAKKALTKHTGTRKTPAKKTARTPTKS